MSRFHRGYAIAALALAAIVFAVTLLAFLEWGRTYGGLLALAVVVIGGAVSFIANWREAFERPQAQPSSASSSGNHLQADAIATMGGVAAADRGVAVGGNVEGGIHIYESAAPSPALSLHQIPPPPPDFTGRTAELKELLANFDKGAAISGLRGMGGVGKTALALELARQIKSRYPDAQFFLDLQGTSEKPLSPREAMAHVVRAYYPDKKLPDDEAEVRGLYYSVLDGKRALLLMDNAKDAAQVELLRPPDTCALVVTSRHKFALSGFAPVDLDALPPEDARKLLLKIAPATKSAI